MRSPASSADPPLDVPPAWIEAADHVRRHAARRVLVIGARDTGKSAFCRFLADAVLQAGRRAALLDTDLGQKIIGPPACVTMADAHGPSLAFVGTTNPVLGRHRLIAGARRLAQQADADCLVVNTGGLLAGPGRRLKAAKIEALQPDLLIALGEGESLGLIGLMAGDRPAPPLLRLPSSSLARRKTDGERRALRREAFRRYFATASVLHPGRDLLETTGSDALPAGLVLGLSDDRNNDIGLGLLVEDRIGTAIEILSPVAEAAIARIARGFLRLDGDFSETPVLASQGTSG